MSKMSELAIEIEELYRSGFSPLSISVMLDISVSMVYDWLECQSDDIEVEYD